MRKEIYLCDQCGAEKKQMNHWLAVCFSDGPKGVPFIEIHPFFAARETDQHICGTECLMKKISMFEEKIRLMVDSSAVNSNAV